MPDSSRAICMYILSVLNTFHFCFFTSLLFFTTSTNLLLHRRLIACVHDEKRKKTLNCYLRMENSIEASSEKGRRRLQMPNENNALDDFAYLFGMRTVRFKC